MNMNSGLLGLLLMVMVTNVTAQGGGGKNGGDPVTASGPDTTYHAVTQTIYSISEKDPNDTSLVTKYTVYFLNGEVQYYCTYEYSNKNVTKINYFDGNGQQYAYGTYAGNSLGGKDYFHYASDGTLISKTEYDANWISHQFTAYTSGQKSKYRIVNTIKDGYIIKENYFNEVGTLVGEGVWTWNPVTEVTLYTYTVKNGKKLKHSVTGDEYDRYETYYHNYLKDSLKLYDGEINASNLVYTAKYNYNENGYMTEDKYYIDGVLKSFGNYTFDNSTFITTYTYKLAPDTLLWVTTYDYRHYYLKTENYSRDKKVISTVTYEYDKYGNFSKVSLKDAAGNLLSYETYTYYEPYSILKEYAVFDSNDKKGAYITYDIYGNIITNAGIRRQINTYTGKNYILQSGIDNQQIYFDVKGRVVGRNIKRHIDSKAATGVYINKNSYEKRINLLKK